MNFKQFDLDARLHAGIELAGFREPTPIQQQAIPHILAGRDVLGLAQTGTGKTAAFMLPILQRLTRGPLRRVRALILAPTRELAEQIREASETLAQRTKIRTVSIYGGVSKGPQLSALKRGAEVVVACPGRLLDHMGEGDIDLSQVEVLVLDEADRMCDMGFLPDVRRIIDKLPKQRQTLFFSATMPDDIRQLAKEILREPVTVQVDMTAPAKTVSHAIYPIPNGLKKRLLLDILERTPTGRVLVFTRTKRRARNLARDLEKARYRVAALQGNMTQNRRQQAMQGFRDGKFDILVATDIAARGIDVADISHVINFDMPDTVDAYTHRIGRTGRAQETGEAFTFVTADDEPLVRAVERLLGEPIERRRQPDFDYSGFNPDEQGQPKVQVRQSRPQTRTGSPAEGGNGASGSNRRRRRRNTQPKSTASSPESRRGASRRRRRVDPHHRSQG